MRLLIIGHTAHYRNAGNIQGWGPTVTEVDWLAKAFDSVAHLAFLHPTTAPTSAKSYSSGNVRFVGLSPSGGLSIKSKLRAIINAPEYLQAIQSQVRQADVIQIRTPGILGLYGLLYVSLFSRVPHWTKYAGNWIEPSKMPLSFRFQRSWLQHGWSHGPVTINGRWPGQKDFIYSFVNPSLSISEILQARDKISGKQLNYPIRCVFAGRLDSNKQPLEAIEITKIIGEKIPIRLDILGDGPDKDRCQNAITKLNPSTQVNLHGWVSQGEVKQFMSQAHFILLPSLSEGWPKVLSEGMAYGAVPVASAVSAIPQLLNKYQCGYSLPASDTLGFAETILNAVHEKSRWDELSRSGQAAAIQFSYERYLLELDKMFQQYYRFSPMNQSVIQDLTQQYQAAQP